MSTKYLDILNRRITLTRGFLSSYAATCCISFSLLFTSFIRANPAFAQDGDTLSDVIIHTLPIDHDVKGRFVSDDSEYTIDKRFFKINIHTSLDEVMRRYSTAFVRQYGVNTQASLNIRGSSPAQNLVVWEGVPITNIFNGIADISIMNNVAFDRAKVYTGSQGAIFGSGAMGGVLSLEKDVVQDSKMLLSLQGGSFGHRQLFQTIHGSVKGVYLSLVSSVDIADNNFSFVDNNSRIQKMPNAKHEKINVLGTAYKGFRVGIGDSLTIKMSAWMYQNERNIPPALFETLSTKNMTDKGIRSVAKIKYTRNRYHPSEWFLTASYNIDETKYHDTIALIQTQYHSRQAYQELGYQKALMGKHDRHDFLVYVPLNHQSIIIGNNYHRQNIYGLSAAYKYAYRDGKVRWQVQVRQELVNQDMIPLLYGSSVAYRPLHIRMGNQHTIRATMSAQYQKAYRLPTLGELYAFPGGNGRLRPEQSDNWDFGIKTKYSRVGGRATLSLDYQVHYFHRDVYDWIYWLGGSIWTPHNISKVWSRGWDHHWKANLYIQRFGSVYWHSGLAYTIATTRSIRHIQNAEIIGKQIPYTPRYLSSNNIGVEAKHWLVNVSHAYTGYRFYTLDEQGFLTPYHLLGISATYNMVIKDSYTYKVTASVDNILNTRYELANGRPMPGRSYSIGFVMDLVFPKRKS